MPMARPATATTGSTVMATSLARDTLRRGREREKSKLFSNGMDCIDTVNLAKRYIHTHDRMGTKSWIA